jgi:hypothetical protein
VATGRAWKMAKGHRRRAGGGALWLEPNFEILKTKVAQFSKFYNFINIKFFKFSLDFEI